MQTGRSPLGRQPRHYGGALRAHRPTGGALSCTYARRQAATAFVPSGPAFTPPCANSGHPAEPLTANPTPYRRAITRCSRLTGHPPQPCVPRDTGDPGHKRRRSKCARKLNIFIYISGCIISSLLEHCRRILRELSTVGTRWSPALPDSCYPLNWPAIAPLIFMRPCPHLPVPGQTLKAGGPRLPRASGGRRHESRVDLSHRS